MNAPPATPSREASATPARGHGLLAGALGRWRDRKLGLNLVGYARGGLGLGENLRRFAEAAHAQGHPFALVDFALGLGDRAGDSRLDAWIGDENPHRTNVFFVNADQMALAREHFGAAFWRGRRNVGFWFWELSRFPPAWHDALDLVDEVWVGSRFVAEAIGAVTNKPVRRIALPVDVTVARGAGRTAFGLPENRFLFLYTFDFHSYAVRKNPWGAIEAFRRAFPPHDERAMLVLKSVNADRAPALAASIAEAVAGDPRIVTIDRYLDRAHAGALLAACDAYLSLHRSEGFGLGMAEAMLAGKPVVASAYSGNLDFMDEANSCLVRCTEVPVRAGEYPWGEGQTWADPDLDHAGAYMRRIVDAPSFAASVGARAAETIRRRHDARACIASVRAALGALV